MYCTNLADSGDAVSRAMVAVDGIIASQGVPSDNALAMLFPNPKVRSLASSWPCTDRTEYVLWAVFQPASNVAGIILSKHDQVLAAQMPKVPPPPLVLLRLTASVPRAGVVLHLGAAGSDAAQRLEATLSGVAFSLAEDSEVGLGLAVCVCCPQRQSDNSHRNPLTTIMHHSH